MTLSKNSFTLATLTLMALLGMQSSASAQYNLGYAYHHPNEMYGGKITYGDTEIGNQPHRYLMSRTLPANGSYVYNGSL